MFQNRLFDSGQSTSLSIDPTSPFFPRVAPGYPAIAERPTQLSRPIGVAQAVQCMPTVILHEAAKTVERSIGRSGSHVCHTVGPVTIV